MAMLLYSDGYDPNIFYLTGYRGIGFLMVERKKTLIVPKMEYEKASMCGINAVCSDNLLLDVKKLATAKTIGIDKSRMPVALYEKLNKRLKTKFTDCSKRLMEMRKIKTKDEIANIRKACRITDDVFVRFLKGFGFSNEAQVKRFIEFEIKKAGCDLAFEPIVASGTNSSNPHYNGSGRLEPGFLVLDFGAKYNGYCADMTRTIFLGKPNADEKKKYGLLLKIQKKIIDEIKEGTETGKLDRDCRKMLGKDKKFFIHSLGHGVGLEIHELPAINIKSRDKIKKGIVFTVEPGLYYPGRYGIRIEDTLAFEDRAELLTRSAKGLIVI